MTETFYDRLLTEKRDLDEKLDKLRAFLKTDACFDLTFDQRSLLVEQEAVMGKYSAILAERIGLVVL